MVGPGEQPSIILLCCWPHCCHHRHCLIFCQTWLRYCQWDRTHALVSVVNSGSEYLVTRWKVAIHIYTLSDLSLMWHICSTRVTVIFGHWHWNINVNATSSKANPYVPYFQETINLVKKCCRWKLVRRQMNLHNHIMLYSWTFKHLNYTKHLGVEWEHCRQSIRLIWRQAWEEWRHLWGQDGGWQRSIWCQAACSYHHCHWTNYQFQQRCCLFQVPCSW